MKTKNPLALFALATTLLSTSAGAAQNQNISVCQFALSSAEYQAGLPVLRLTLEQTDQGIHPDQNGRDVSVFNVEFAGTRGRDGSLSLDKNPISAMAPALNLSASLYPDMMGSKALIPSVSLADLVGRIKSDERVALFVLAAVSTTVRDFEPKHPLTKLLISSFQKNISCR